MGERFVLSIECDNAAFAEGEREAEVARILRRTAQRLEDLEVAIGNGGGSLLDINGNRVGCFAFVLEVEQRCANCPGSCSAPGCDCPCHTAELTDEEWEASARG